MYLEWAPKNVLFFCLFVFCLFFSSSFCVDSQKMMGRHSVSKNAISSGIFANFMLKLPQNYSISQTARDSVICM